MTIDEMIKALFNESEFGDVWVEEETCAAIIAALKAAHAMRDAWEHLKEAEGFYSPKSCAAWDAVMKGDEG